MQRFKPHSMPCSAFNGISRSSLFRIVSAAGSPRSLKYHLASPKWLVNGKGWSPL